MLEERFDLIELEKEREKRQEIRKKRRKEAAKEQEEGKRATSKSSKKGKNGVPNGKLRLDKPAYRWKAGRAGTFLNKKGSFL